MAGERTFVVKFISDIVGATKGIKKVGDDLGILGKQVDTNFGSKFKSVMPSFKAFAIAGTAAFAGIGAALFKSVEAAIESQAEQNRLRQILKTTTGASDQQIDSLNKQAQALQNLGVVSAGTTSVVQSQLATFDLSISTIRTLTPAILDYVTAEKGASATTDDFKSSTNGLAQALQGNFASLTKTGFVLDDATKKTIKSGTESQRAAALVAVLGSTYEGFNESLRNTPQGQLIALRNDFNDLVTAIGTALIPHVTKFVTMLNENVVPAVRRITTVLGEKGFIGAIQQLLFELGDAGPRIANFFEGIAVGAAMAANTISGLFGGIKRFIKALNPFATELGEINKIDIDALRESFQNTFKAINNYTVRGIPSAILAQQALGDSAKELTGDDTKGLGKVAKSLGFAEDKLKQYGNSLKKTTGEQKSFDRAQKSEGKALTSLTNANDRLAKARANLAQIEGGFGVGSPQALAAQRELDKAQRDQERATYAVEEAIYSVADAEKNLVKVRKEPESSPMDIRRAELNLAEAKLSVTDAIDSQIDSTKELNDQQKLLNETIFGATVGSMLYDQALADVTDAFNDQVSAFESWELAVTNTKEAQDDFNASLQATVDLIAKYPKVLGGMPNPMAGVSGQVPVTAGGGFSLRPNDTYQINVNAAIAEQGLPQKVVEALQQYNRSIGKIPVRTK